MHPHKDAILRKLVEIMKRLANKLRRHKAAPTKRGHKVAVAHCEAPRADKIRKAREITPEQFKRLVEQAKRDYAEALRDLAAL